MNRSPSLPRLQLLCGLMVAASLACSGSSTQTSETDSMNPAITGDRLTHMQLEASPFDQADLTRWGLDGTWTWHVGFQDQDLRFSIEGDELVATSSYGTFRGGELDGVLVLSERIEGPGPPSTTWVNLCLLYTSPSPRDRTRSRMPSSA